MGKSLFAEKHGSSISTNKLDAMACMGTRAPKVLPVLGGSLWVSLQGTYCPLPGCGMPLQNSRGMEVPWPGAAVREHPWPLCPALSVGETGGRMCPVPRGCGGCCLAVPTIINLQRPWQLGCHSLTALGLKSYQPHSFPCTISSTGKTGYWCCPFLQEQDGHWAELWGTTLVGCVGTGVQERGCCQKLPQHPSRAEHSMDPQQIRKGGEGSDSRQCSLFPLVSHHRQD